MSTETQLSELIERIENLEQEFKQQKDSIQRMRRPKGASESWEIASPFDGMTTAKILREIADAIEESTTDKRALNDTCKKRDINSYSVRKILCSRPFQQILLGETQDLKDMDIQEYDNYAKLYRKIFEAIDPSANIVLPTDYKETMDKILEGLSEREALVIRERFGLEDDPKTLEQVGELLQVSRERVRQIEVKTIRKMRRPPRQDVLKYGLAEYEIILEQRRRNLETNVQNFKSNLEEETSCEGLAAIPIESLGLSVRSQNCLKRAKIYNIQEVLKAEATESLTRTRNLGEKSLKEINNAICTILNIRESQLAEIIENMKEPQDA